MSLFDIENVFDNSSSPSVPQPVGYIAGSPGHSSNFSREDHQHQLSSYPRCSLYRSTPQVLGSGGSAELWYNDLEEYDENNMASSGVVFINTMGLYLLTAFCYFTNVSAGTVQLIIQETISGTIIGWAKHNFAAAGDGVLTCSGVIRLAAGSRVAVLGYNPTAGNVTFFANQPNRFTATMMGYF